MKNCILLLISILFLSHIQSQENPDCELEVQTSIQESPPVVILQWEKEDGTTINIFRKSETQKNWKSIAAGLNESVSRFFDSKVRKETSYEYKIEKIDELGTPCFVTVSVGINSVENEAGENGAPKHRLNLDAHAHVYVFANTNAPQSKDNSVFGVYDQKYNQFGIGITQFSLAYSNPKSSLNLDLNFGPAAELVNGNSIGGTSNIIQNAYFTYSPNDKLSFDIGKFGTHIGYELIDATQNVHYTYSYLFNYGPFYHLGLKANYAFSGKYALMVGIFNNWDDLVDNNSHKSFGASFNLAPVEGLDMYLNWIGGNEADGEIDAFRSLFDLSIGYSVSDNLSLGLNLAVGSEKIHETATVEGSDGIWKGVAGYVHFKLNPVFGLGFRAEYFDDTKAIRGFNTDVTEFTLTGDINLANETLLVKPEIRYDLSSDEIFEDKSGDFTRNYQVVFGIAFMYRFERRVK